MEPLCEIPSPNVTAFSLRFSLEKSAFSKSLSILTLQTVLMTVKLLTALATLPSKPMACAARVCFPMLSISLVSLVISRSRIFPSSSKTT